MTSAGLLGQMDSYPGMHPGQLGSAAYSGQYGTGPQALSVGPLAPQHMNNGYYGQQ
jgi:hypothetical protein